MAQPRSKKDSALTSEDAAVLKERLLLPRVVVSLTAQAAVFLPGGGGSHTNLNDSKCSGIQMIHLPGCGVFIEHRGQKSFTPDTNLKEVWYEPEKTA